MKFTFAFLLVVFVNVDSYGQASSLNNYTRINTGSDSLKTKVVDESLILQWSGIRGVSISNDGSYVASLIRNRPVGGECLLVQSIRKDWEKQFNNIASCFFSADSKKLIFTREDTLSCWILGSDQVAYISNLKSSKFPLKNAGEWIAYELKGDIKTLVLLNLLNGKEERFDSVCNYTFNDMGTSLLIEKNEENRNLLQFVNLNNLNLSNIYEGQINSISTANLDDSGKQLVFTVKSSSNTPGADMTDQNNSIWYFREGMEKAVLKVTNITSGIESGLFIQPDAKFSMDARYISFYLKANETKQVAPKEAVKVNIWNYKDSLIQSHQLGSPGQEKVFLCVIPAGEGHVERILRLEQVNEKIVSDQLRGNFVVVRKDNQDARGDRFWLPYKCSYKLIALNSGISILLNMLDNKEAFFSFSPEDRYLVWYDARKEQYFSYDLNLNKQANISINIPKAWLSYQDEFDKPKQVYFPVDKPIWLPDHRSILINDNYDIWLLDLSGKKPAVNFTSGYGRKHHIKFKIITTKPEDIVTEDSLLLAAYNTRTKHNGFYQLSSHNKGQPVLLTMGPYAYYHWQQTGIREKFDEGMEPVKAAKSNAWIVSRQSFNEAPNYFFTKDFKSYQQLTNLQPFRGYNWLNAELVNFKQLDGSPGQGILYKPENFDPKKKYPLLINYYKNLSGRLYECPIPDLTGSAFLDIPWFVSRDYLVFTPDIYFTRYETGPSAYNSVVAAAKFLSKMKYVDNKRMGIAGHSFAGGLTNYLVTHTNLFAAAFEGAGESDKLRRVFELPARSGFASKLEYLQRLKPFWENPDPWIKNSPIFQVDKITTPLLMFHCRADEAVLWDQAPPLFLALRYLNKKVWLIEYDDGDHGVSGKNAQDLTIRVTQFFDHYLKGTPAPKWMTRGIPANRKGVDNGLELDVDGN